MIKAIVIIVFLIIIISFSGCSFNNSEKNEWMGFYYPDRDDIGNEKTWVIQSNLSSLFDCQDWVADISGDNLKYDYECGYKCEYDGIFQSYICEKTVK